MTASQCVKQKIDSKSVDKQKEVSKPKTMKRLDGMEWDFWVALKRHIDVSKKSGDARKLCEIIGMDTGQFSRIKQTYEGENPRQKAYLQPDTMEDIAIKFLGFKSATDLIINTLNENEISPNDREAQSILNQKKQMNDFISRHMLGSVGVGENEYIANNAYFQTLPLVKLKLSAGDGSYETQTIAEKHLSFRTDWLNTKGNPDSMIIAHVYGDSMCPTLEHEDIVLIDTSYKSIINHKIYAVAHEKEVKIKRIVRDKEEIYLVPDNIELYSSEKIQPNEYFQIIGRVLWVAREL